MDKFSMAMGITLLNRIALFAMTLTPVDGVSKSTTWSI
jgi:phage terminase large subunit-like protein